MTGPLGRRILAERAACGWNQIETAQHLGVSQQTLSTWENGAAPRRDSIARVARFLGITQEQAIQLAYGSGKPTTRDRVRAYWKAGINTPTCTTHFGAPE